MTKCALSLNQRLFSDYCAAAHLLTRLLHGPHLLLRRALLEAGVEGARLDHLPTRLLHGGHLLDRRAFRVADVEDLA